jgi:hypothetical protein
MEANESHIDGDAQAWLDEHAQRLDAVADECGLAPGLVRLAAVLVLHGIPDDAIYDELNTHLVSLDGQHAPLAGAPHALDEIRRIASRP